MPESTRMASLDGVTSQKIRHRGLIQPSGRGPVNFPVSSLFTPTMKSSRIPSANNKTDLVKKNAGMIHNKFEDAFGLNTPKPFSASASKRLDINSSSSLYRYHLTNPFPLPASLPALYHPGSQMFSKFPLLMSNSAHLAVPPYKPMVTNAEVTRSQRSMYESLYDPKDIHRSSENLKDLQNPGAETLNSRSRSASPTDGKISKYYDYVIERIKQYEPKSHIIVV